MNLSTALSIIAFLAQFVGWLERVKAIKAAEANLFRRLISAARSEADAITLEMDAAACRADADGLRDKYERP